MTPALTRRIYISSWLMLGAIALGYFYFLFHTTLNPQVAQSSGTPAAQAESTEARRIEFEVHAPHDARGTEKLSAYALYYVCEEAGGTCFFLRQDIPIEVKVGK